MPYVECSRCGMTAFTAAYRNEPEHCARCGTELPRPRKLVSIADHPRFLSDPTKSGPPGLHAIDGR